MSSTKNEIFVHYIFMDNKFVLPTASGLPLTFALSGIFTPGAKGGLNFAAQQVGSHSEIIPWMCYIIKKQMKITETFVCIFSNIICVVFAEGAVLHAFHWSRVCHPDGGPGP